MKFSEAQICLNDYMTLGKYGPNGKEGPLSLRAIIAIDAAYIRFLLEKEIIEIDDEAHEFLRQSE